MNEKLRTDQILEENNVYILFLNSGCHCLNNYMPYLLENLKKKLTTSTYFGIVQGFVIRRTLEHAATVEQTDIY